MLRLGSIMVRFISPIVPLSSKIIEKLNYDTIFRNNGPLLMVQLVQ